MRNFQKNFLDKKIIPAKINQYMIWPIPIGDLANTGWCFGQYWLAIWPIPVGNLANTGEGTFSKIWAGLRSKSKILKILRPPSPCLRNMLDIKKSILLDKCPFKSIFMKL